MSAPAAITNRARALAPGSIIELFLLDASMINSRYTGAPGPIFAFHNSNAQGTDPITFQGIDYQPFPISADRYESNSKGQLPRPQISFSNIGAIGSAMLREFYDLRNAKITRKRTLFEFLDAPLGTSPDPIQEFPPEIFYVDLKAAENHQIVTLELGSNLDTQNVLLPGRPLTANACVWWYRSGDGCDYAGAPATDQFGAPFAGPLNPRGAYDQSATYQAKDYAYRLINGVREYRVCMVNGTHANLVTGVGLITDPTHWTLDVCTKTLAACKLRFGADNPLPTSVFPAILRAPVSQ